MGHSCNLFKEKLKLLEKYSEIAVVFSQRYSEDALELYNDVAEQFPDKEVYLIPSHDVICPRKLDDFQSYIVVGTSCPVHAFDDSRSVQYKTAIPEYFLESIAKYNGAIIYDSVYQIECSDAVGTETAAKCMDRMDNVMIVSENKLLIEYYSREIESITTISNIETNNTANTVNISEVRYKVTHLMKEHTNVSKAHDKKAFLVIFTHKSYESYALEICERLRVFSNAYTAFLKDVSYERLISMDNIDCIVLIDCAVFRCDIRVHIPIISPLSAEMALQQLEKSKISDSENAEASGDRQIQVYSGITEIMVNREYQGVPYGNRGSCDVQIHKGQDGIASRYCDECDRKQPSQ